MQRVGVVVGDKKSPREMRQVDRANQRVDNGGRKVVVRRVQLGKEENKQRVNAGWHYGEI